MIKLCIFQHPFPSHWALGVMQFQKLYIESLFGKILTWSLIPKSLTVVKLPITSSDRSIPYSFLALLALYFSTCQIEYYRIRRFYIPFIKKWNRTSIFYIILQKIYKRNTREYHNGLINSWMDFELRTIRYSAHVESRWGWRFVAFLDT